MKVVLDSHFRGISTRRPRGAPNPRAMRGKGAQILTLYPRGRPRGAPIPRANPTRRPRGAPNPRDH